MVTPDEVPTACLYCPPPVLNGTFYITVVSGQLWHKMAIFVVLKFPYSLEPVLSSHPAIPVGERLIQVLEPANCRGNVTK